ncbi:Histone acetyltransferase type B catalytic subunit [Folsomia candida]|uniref:Histone acetyltransferase type B catalytic subunit n=1 Tax=Folsomia candida TaxID=158441 RepID=A0A226CT22_FOLCA|nr:Histone acetyltransferase type B catalytic subunit [Folsomia candida]
MQSLWKLKHGWDEPLPLEIQNQWTILRSNMEAYAAAVYLCVYDGQSSSSSLITSKSRVAPVKTVSLPRLELCGAELLAELLIGTSMDQFPTIKMEDLCRQSGHQDPGEGPSHHVESHSSEAIAEQKQASSLQPLSKLINCYLNGIHHFQNYFGNCLRISIHQESQRSQIHPSPLFTGGLPAISDTTNLSPLITTTEVTYSPLSPDEINCAKLYWIRLVQQQEFPREIHALQAGQPVNSKSKIVSFCPFLDSGGVLKVEGRLNHSDLPASQKHPILLTSTIQLLIFSST